MGDMLFDDFDVDALLDAQSSDDDGNDLPDLERSLDEILNDSEFADVLGESVSANSSNTVSSRDSKSSDHVANGRATTGLDGQLFLRARGESEESLNRGKLHEAEKSALISIVGNESYEELLSVTNPRTNFNQDDGDKKSSSMDSGVQVPPPAGTETATGSGIEYTGTDKGGTDAPGFQRTGTVLRSLGAWESNGRSSITPASVSLLPPVVGSKSSLRPGAAFAAAAAASRQSVIFPNAASKFMRTIFALQEGTETETAKEDNNFLELHGDSSTEDQVNLDVVSNGGSHNYELEGESQNLQSIQQELQENRLAEVILLDDTREDDSFGNSVGREAITAIEESLDRIETLSSSVAESEQLSSLSRSSDSSATLAEVDPDRELHLVPEFVPDDFSSLEESEIEHGLLANELGSDEPMDSQVGIDNPFQRSNELDTAEPELSDVDSLNNWIDEPEEQVEVSSLGTVDVQIEISQSSTRSRGLMDGNEVQGAAEELMKQMGKLEMENQVAIQAIEEEQRRTALQLAEELERKAASSGLHWEEGAVAQPMRLEGIQRGAPAIGFLQLDSGGSLSVALQSAAMRRDHGLPQALAVHSNFIAIGLSKGAVLVIPSKYSATRSADETDAKPFVLALPGSDKSHSAVSSMCFNQQGDILLVGYSNGHLMLWDVPRATVVKGVEKEHSVAIVHALFLGQDVIGARNFKAITSDSRGLTLLHAFTVLPVLRRYSVSTSCLMDGQRTGMVLSISPLLPDEGLQNTGGSNVAPHGLSSSPINLGSVISVVGGAGTSDVGRKFLYDGASSTEESGGGLVVFVTQQAALVVRLQTGTPPIGVCAKLTRPEGIRDGAIPYTAWRRTKSKCGAPTNSVSPAASANVSSVESGQNTSQKETEGRPTENAQSREDGTVEGALKNNSKGGENSPLLAMAWDKKVLVLQLLKTELKVVAQWTMDNPAVGVAWLEEQMMVVATSKDELYLFTNEGIEIERAALGSEHGGIGAVIYHTHFLNLYGNPEKAFHNALAVRGAAVYLLGPARLWRARLLPWRDRIKALQNAGDWMGAFHIAMEIYDGRSQGVTGLPRGLEAMREAIMPTLLALLSAYIDEAFAYLSLALGSSASSTISVGSETVTNTEDESKLAIAVDTNGVKDYVQEMVLEAKEQYARVGGVAIEFCVHIRKTEVLFENVFSKFEAVGQRGTFLELLEPYILKDMLGGLAPEVMQALVEHYSSRGWLNRVEQCVLHMDIASLDFNQVVRVCRDHGLYSALIYLFNKGLDDFKSPLEELLAVAQASDDPSQAKSFGLKLLVYLKYCFSGLSFPPGNGTLPPARLPKLRTELLGYLLGTTENSEEEVVDPESIEKRSYSRIFYLLALDTQATLQVLGAAFPEDGPLGVGKRDWVYPLIRTKSEQDALSKLGELQFKGYALSTEESIQKGLKLAQDTVNAIIIILQTVRIIPSSSMPEKDFGSSKVSSGEQWLSQKDTGDMLEFVAHFAAGKYAVVSAAVLSRILEHLTSSVHESSAKTHSSEKRRRTIVAQREDLMVALLTAVPKSEWDAQRTLQLAQKAEFWQVTALVHAQSGDYPAALDSYLKDVNRPQHAFTFLSRMLSSDGGLQGSDLSSFQETVLSHIPELIQLSTVSALLVVLKYFSSENQRILKELAPYPKLLFNYLKAMMNIRSGDLDYSEGQLEPGTTSPRNPQHGESSNKSHLMAMPGLGHNRDEAHSVLESQVHLADLLERSGLEFTNEMAETFVELLCRFEPKSVLTFLERYENYRLEHCLRLCQEYGVTDAAAFLLERVGDVASALSLVLADIHSVLRAMDQTIARLSVSMSLKKNLQKMSDDEFLDSAEVATAHDILKVAVALCQRNTFRLEPKESEELWFRLLDRFVEPLQDLNMQYRSSSMSDWHNTIGENRSHLQKDRVPSRNSPRWKVLGSDLATKFFRKVLVRFIGDIVNGMMGYVPISVTMGKILQDHGGHEFGDFKATILDMLSAYGYERAILGTAKQLIEDDTFENISALRRSCTHAFTPLGSICSVCSLPLDKPVDTSLSKQAAGGSNERSSSSTSNNDRQKAKVDEESSSSSVDEHGLKVRIFPCGHATHFDCVDTDSGSRTSSTATVCPICSYGTKTLDLALNGKDSNLLKKSGVEIKSRNASRHNSADFSRTQRMHRTTNGMFGKSRLELLKQLERGTGLNELGPSLHLSLAPAYSYHQRLLTSRTGGSATGRGKKIPPSLPTSSKDTWLSTQRKLKSRTR